MSRELLSGVIAFMMWGFFPLFWKLFPNVPAMQLFSARLLFSAITLWPFVLWKQKHHDIIDVLKNKRRLIALIISAILITSNWLLYIYAIEINKVLEASMGYFLNPLINAAIGWIILKEPFRKTQLPAVILAVIAVVILFMEANIEGLPWIALSLSITFAGYGVMRKFIQVGSLEGLTFETTILAPFILIWLFYNPPAEVMNLPFNLILLLSLSGLITSLPLILFAYSTKRLPLSILGFVQYLSPLFKFVCGYFILHEPLSRGRMTAFVIIWIALIFYSLESLSFHKNKNSSR